MAKRTCMVDGCESPHLAKGYCCKHYSRLRTTGDPLKVKKYSRAKKPYHKCSIDGCEGAGRTRGLCATHYQRWLKYGEPQKGGTYKSKKPAECIVEGCCKSVVAIGYCASHYSMFRKHGDPLVRSDWFNKRFEKIINDQGYVEVYVGSKHPMAKGDGRALEHRLVMSEKIGRPLRPNESVHHINGDKKDNRSENLQLWVKTHPSGQRPEDLVAWALEILEVYGEEVNGQKLKIIKGGRENERPS